MCLGNRNKSISKVCKGNDTANFFKGMKLGIVDFFIVWIQNFESTSSLGLVIDDVTVDTNEISYLQNRSYYVPLGSKFYAR